MSHARKDRSGISRIGLVQSKQGFDCRSEPTCVSLPKEALEMKSQIMRAHGKGH